MFQHRAMNKIISTTIDKFMINNEISTESDFIVDFFAVSSKPETVEDDIETKDWLSSVVECNGYIFVGSFSGSLEVFKVQSNNKLSSIEEYYLHDLAIKSLFCTTFEDSKDKFCVIGSGSRNGEIKLSIFSFKTEKLNTYYKLIGHVGSIECLAYLHDSDDLLITSGSWDKKVCLFKLSIEDIIEKGFESKRDQNRTIEIAPESIICEDSSKISSILFINGREDQDSAYFICYSTNENQIKLFTKDGSLLVTINGKKQVTCLSYCSASHTLISSHFDSSIRLWDLFNSNNNYLKLKLNSKHTDKVMSTCKLLDDVLLSADYQGNIFVWSLLSSKPLHVLKRAHEGKIFDISFVSKSCFVSVGSDCKVKLHLFS